MPYYPPAQNLVYNVKTYGAVGDGSTDDATAINAAISAANSAGGGRVYFPTATYIVGASLTVYSNIIYDLNGSTVKLKAASNTDVFIGQNFASLTGTNVTDGVSDPRNWSMINGIIDGNASNQSSGTGKGLKVYAHQYLLQNLNIINNRGDGFYSEWSTLGTITAPTNNMESKIMNCKFSSNGGWGVSFKGPHDSLFFGCESYSNTTGNFYAWGNAAATKFVNCHGYLTTTICTQIDVNAIEWIDSTAEITSPGTAIQINANECHIEGGLQIDPQASGSCIGIELANSATDTYINTTIQTTQGGSVKFTSSGGYNTVNVKAFQTSGTIILGTPTKTDNVQLMPSSQVFGRPLGAITGSNLTRPKLTDPAGTAYWCKLGTYYGDSSGGARLVITLHGTGGYNADAASVGKTVIYAALGNGSPTPNIQGAWYTANGSAMIDSVKFKKGADVYTWDVYIHLLAVYTGNTFVDAQTGPVDALSGFVFINTSSSDPGVASTTVAVATEQFKIISPATLSGGATVNNNLTANGTQQTFNSYTQINGSLDVLAGNILVNNSATNIGAGVFVGKDDGNQYTNFILADNTYPLDANPGGHYWAFSHRHGHNFLIFNYNGAGTYNNMLSISEAGAFTLFDGANLVLGTSTGTKIGTATNQKIGFFNSTPIVQPTGDIITALQNLGLVGSATISEADVTNLTTDLAAKAPLASPTFTGSVTLPAGTTGTAPLMVTHGTNLTTATADAIENDAIGMYLTTNTTDGRAHIPARQHFRLTSNGSNVTTIGNFFGSTSNIKLVASAYYEIEIVCWFTKTTSEALTWTFTNSAAPTSMNIHVEQSPITGVVTTAAAYLGADVINSSTAAQTYVTGSLSTGVNHFAKFRITLKNGSGTSLKIQATNPSGSITPLLGSYWTAVRIPTGNTGAFAA